MNYLLYVEFTAEHLQFFLWFRSYVERFDALKATEKALSPEWTSTMQASAINKFRNIRAEGKKVPLSAITALKGIGRNEESKGASNPFVTPPPTSHGKYSHVKSASTVQSTFVPWECLSTFVFSGTNGSVHTNHSSNLTKGDAATVASEAFEKAGLPQPCKRHSCYIYTIKTIIIIQSQYNPFVLRSSEL
jgi:hypothetical protein